MARDRQIQQMAGLQIWLLALTPCTKRDLLGEATRVYTDDKANRLRSSVTNGTVTSTLSLDSLGELAGT